ncbi:hypothetical protein [Halopenitus persicus]|uniref:Uncharacterized protein n=1 Tax=Halopenitus persicus TaxID=1048396 RepID=A0A1H3MRH0_9EURY|nr:hypothetical protein [Halopenitus persicus]QHS16215.1 hypothetical protein GWK26_03085 [haloarchaeon 3A1-DGR]SDY79110.1 hypothetical protein SAMN05216564_11051 [Halopenitus persicus]
MKRPDRPAHQFAIAIALGSAAVVAVLLFLPLTAGSDPASRLATAKAAVSLADQLPLLVGVGAGFGLAAGSVIGGLRAYHQEVEDR